MDDYWHIFEKLNSFKTITFFPFSKESKNGFLRKNVKAQITLSWFAFLIQNGFYIWADAYWISKKCFKMRITLKYTSVANKSKTFTLDISIAPILLKITCIKYKWKIIFNHFPILTTNWIYVLSISYLWYYSSCWKRKKKTILSQL